jgi:hypothetical protein
MNAPYMNSEGKWILDLPSGGRMAFGSQKEAVQAWNDNEDATFAANFFLGLRDDENAFYAMQGRIKDKLVRLFNKKYPLWLAVNGPAWQAQEAAKVAEDEAYIPLPLPKPSFSELLPYLSEAEKSGILGMTPERALFLADVLYQTITIVPDDLSAMLYSYLPLQ